MSRSIAVIDPAVQRPEIESFNLLSELSPLPVTYHLPALVGIGSLLHLKRPSGIIILGSYSSVNDQHPWQVALGEWLLPLLKTGVPTLGNCFGHQLIASLLGGKVQFLKPDKRKRVGFRTINFGACTLWNHRPIRKKLFVSHREVVTTCPPGMKVLGHSLEVPIEGLVHEKLPIWTFQAHPEVSTEFIKNSGLKSFDEKTLKFGRQILTSYFQIVKRNHL